MAAPPKPKKLPRQRYERELLRLQRELVEMQKWVRGSGARLVVVFEGRDAAGKGGAIQRIAEYLNPRVCRIVALPAPMDLESLTGGRTTRGQRTRCSCTPTPRWRRGWSWRPRTSGAHGST